MVPLKPQLLVSTATALASWAHHERAEETEDDRGSMNVARRAATLRFVHFLGFWSQFVYDARCSSWPLPRFERIEELDDFADQHGGLASEPMAGDVFLLASFRRNRHVMAGIVAAVETERKMLNGSVEFICTTIEGELASPRGTKAPKKEAEEARVAPRVVGARLVRRRLSSSCGDHFIRWCDLVAPPTLVTVEHRIPTHIISLDPAIRRRAA